MGALGAVVKDEQRALGEMTEQNARIANTCKRYGIVEFFNRSCRILFQGRNYW